MNEKSRKTRYNLNDFRYLRAAYSLFEKMCKAVAIGKGVLL
jgi:hypothetical protein